MARVADVTLWYEALASTHGVVIETEDVERCKQRLYAVRDQAGDPDLYSISIATSSRAPNRELWLVKRTTKNEAA